MKMFVIGLYFVVLATLANAYKRLKERYKTLEDENYRLKCDNDFHEMRRTRLETMYEVIKEWKYTELNSEEALKKLYAYMLLPYNTKY